MNPKKFCPHCQHVYIIGVNGTVTGCDSCEGNVRNPIDGTIINDEINAQYEDTLTDMEKA